MHGDLYGPISPSTSGGKWYFLLVDDYNRYMWLGLLTIKDKAAEAIKWFQAGAEVESGRKLRTLRTDRDSEFMSAAFTDYSAHLGSSDTSRCHTHRSRTTSWSVVTRWSWQWCGVY